MFAQQYASRRVFITGHTGFKGSWLAAWLLELGAVVAGYSLEPPSEPSGFDSLGLKERLLHTHGDVRDREQLARSLASFRPDIVFHLAAQALVRPSYENPALTFESNAMGTLNLLEAVRLTPGVRAVVCITSDKCYRNNEWIWGYRETDRLGGEDPYSASKACAEIIAHAYFASFFGKGPRMATARAGNVIGGGDWAADRIVPDCARAWAAGRSVSLRNPAATRPWQHVLEPLSGYLWLGAKLLMEDDGEGSALHRESFNFGPAAEVNASVAQVADALARHWPGFTAGADPGGGAGKKESTLLKLCCDKALTHLGWKAALPFEETVAFTADWYREYYTRAREGGAAEPGGMYAFTARQIAEYGARAARGGLAWTR